MTTMKLYHGTNSDDFTQFDPETIGTGAWGDIACGEFNAKRAGAAFYLTSSKDHAEFYGDNVLTASVNISNALIVDGANEIAEWRDEVDPERPLDEFIESFGNIYHVLDADEFFTSLVRRAKSEGNDGVIVDFGDLRLGGTTGPIAGNVVVVFVPEQVVLH